MFFAALFMQAHPAAASLGEVIAHVHLQHRADPGEGVNHDADEGPVAQARERAGIDGGEQRPRSSRSSTGVRPFYDMLRAAHRVRRVHVDDMANHKPVKEHADRRQVLLNSRFGEFQQQHLDISRDVQRLHLGEFGQSPALAQFREPAHRFVIARRVFLLRILAVKKSKNRSAALAFGRNRAGDVAAIVARPRGIDNASAALIGAAPESKPFRMYEK